LSADQKMVSSTCEQTDDWQQQTEQYDSHVKLTQTHE
jgi:hypothetical protein